MARKSLATVLKEHSKEVMSIKGVVAIGEGLCDRKPCIKVFVDKMTPEIKQMVPKDIEGYTVEIEESGSFRALDK